MATQLYRSQSSGRHPPRALRPADHGHKDRRQLHPVDQGHNGFGFAALWPGRQAAIPGRVAEQDDDTMNRPTLSVLVLHEAIGVNGRADELDTLAQAEQISSVLRQAGRRVSILQTGLDMGATLASIQALRPDCVFNLVESLGGDGRMIHFIPSLLRTAGVPFTGSAAMPSTSAHRNNLPRNGCG